MAEAVTLLDLATLKVGDFAACVDTTFDMTTPKGVIPLKLLKATDNGVKLHASSKPEDKVRDGGGFSLEFVSEHGEGLPQGVYRFHHPKLGDLEIFLVPCGLVPGGFGYHAVFG